MMRELLKRVMRTIVHRVLGREHACEKCGYRTERIPRVRTHADASFVTPEMIERVQRAESRPTLSEAYRAADDEYRSRLVAKRARFDAKGKKG